MVESDSDSIKVSQKRPGVSNEYEDRPRSSPEQGEEYRVYEAQLEEKVKNHLNGAEVSFISAPFETVRKRAIVKAFLGHLKSSTSQIVFSYSDEEELEQLCKLVSEELSEVHFFDLEKDQKSHIFDAQIPGQKRKLEESKG